MVIKLIYIILYIIDVAIIPNHRVWNFLRSSSPEVLDFLGRYTTSCHGSQGSPRTSKHLSLSPVLGFLGCPGRQDSRTQFLDLGLNHLITTSLMVILLDFNINKIKE